MTYSDAKKEIKKQGYANVTGESLQLAHAENLETFFSVECITLKSKKIFTWGIKHKIDLFKVLEWLHIGRMEEKIWKLFDIIFDDKDLIF